MRFDVASELRLFRESVRAAVGKWEPPREPELGAWQDDRDAALAERVTAAGWDEIWDDGGTAAAIAGGLELGRALAPLCLVDEAALGAPLAVGGRVRHGDGAEACALALPRWGLARAHVAGATREVSLDGTGTVTGAVEVFEELPPDEASARWDAWTAATLAYLAGLAEGALATTVAHARSREQFGRPLARMPAIQARLADAALAVDGLTLLAWQAASPEGRRDAALLWAGSAVREVTASAHQVHGAIGFALESGVHRFYRRAKSAQVWANAVCRAAATR